MEKRQRNYRLLVGPTLIDGKVVDADIVEIKPPFTLEFDIQRNTLQSANTGSIKIYNLSDAIRKKLYKDDFRPDIYKGIQLQAGYGDTIPTIFRGNIYHGWSVRQGPQFISNMEAFDGGDALINAVTNKAYAKGTTYRDMLDDVFRSFETHNVKPGKIGAVPGKLARGNSLASPSADLASLMSNSGFFIDLERANVLADNECVRGAFDTVDSDSGLLGTPLRSQSKLTFDMLFEPRVIMGQRIELKSVTESNFNGTYKVVAIRHRGMISDAVCGTAITSLTLWSGLKSLTEVS